MSTVIDDLRRFAVTRTLFPPTTLKRAIQKLGFVQADPIHAPARAQDLTLRHRAKGYRAGDLERRYAELDVEEDFFVNYGFLPRAVQTQMHPRAGTSISIRGKRAKDVLEFVSAREAVHPREVDDHFSHGSVTNYWGGSSSATTHLLEQMHYLGVLRVARRAGGIRMYSTHAHAPGPDDAAGRRARIDALVDVAVHAYAPVPAITLAWLTNRLRYAVPQWTGELKRALQRAKERLSHVHAGGVDWYWPASENVSTHAPDEVARFLAPFDPIVWDRRRFERFWGWAYRFEAYTPAPRRRFGYYALPLLWHDRVIGWGNLGIVNGELQADIGYVASRPPRERAFARELAAELDRVRQFLGLEC